LHTERGELGKLSEHKARYDQYGVLLDNLLKVDARALLERSERSTKDKQEIEEYLRELVKVNLALVDLEVGAFEAMESGDVEKARSLIVTNQYEEYKAELLELYQKWGNVEKRVSGEYRQKILANSRNVQIYNLGLGVLFIIISIIIPIIINNSVSRPIRELHKATLELEKGNLKVRTSIKTSDELEDLGNEFNKTAEQLEKIDEERKGIDKAKTEFLSITSHELRSPMIPMRAQLQMMEQGYFGKLNEKQKESLDIVLRNTERLDKILVDFLEISRIEAARLKFNFVKISLNEPIHNVIEEMKSFMSEKKVKVIANIERLPVIEVDPDRVMQVLRNLINNAIKFSKENGKVEVSAVVKSSFIEIIVKDDGIGIKKQDQPRLFEPFFQSDNMYQHKSGGTGLGLSICKGIVESQKGKIWFDSIEGKGTTFHFTVQFVPVKEMASIKILFSPKKNIESKLMEVMVEFLGPLGAKEFESLQLKGITEDSLKDYISELHKLGIIPHTEEFKNKIRQIFGEVRGK
jgi:signal transduction histidine kinase